MKPKKLLGDRTTFYQKDIDKCMELLMYMIRHRAVSLLPEKLATGSYLAEDLEPIVWEFDDLMEEIMNYDGLEPGDKTALENKWKNQMFLSEYDDDSDGSDDEEDNETPKKDNKKS